MWGHIVYGYPGFRRTTSTESMTSKSTTLRSFRNSHQAFKRRAVQSPETKGKGEHTRGRSHEYAAPQDRYRPLHIGHSAQCHESVYESLYSHTRSLLWESPFHFVHKGSPVGLPTELPLISPFSARTWWCSATSRRRSGAGPIRGIRSVSRLREKTATAIAAQDGRWTTTIEPPPAGGRVHNEDRRAPHD